MAFFVPSMALAHPKSFAPSYERSALFINAHPGKAIQSLLSEQSLLEPSSALTQEVYPACHSLNPLAVICASPLMGAVFHKKKFFYSPFDLFADLSTTWHIYSTSLSRAQRLATHHRFSYQFFYLSHTTHKVSTYDLMAAESSHLIDNEWFVKAGALKSRLNGWKETNAMYVALNGQFFSWAVFS